MDCSHDIEAEDYIGSVVLSEERFWEILGTDSAGKIMLTRDSAEYVLYVDTLAGECQGKTSGICSDWPLPVLRLRKKGEKSA